jgi:hypothetical protein
MLKRVLFTIVALFFFFTQLNAQTQGCLVNGILYNSSSSQIPNYQCGWTKVGSSTWSSSLQSQCASYGGVSGAFNQIPCPLDDNILFLGFGVALVGAWRLRATT